MKFIEPNFSFSKKNKKQNFLLEKKEKKKKIETFNFINKIANRKELENILSWTFRNYGIEKACILADLLKEIGFKYATKAGISISLEDLKVPQVKNQLLVDTNKYLDNIETKYKKGEITQAEWFQKRIETWNLTSESIKAEILNYFEKTDPLNPVYMMAFSGARGNISQVRQLIGMRGLMSDQKGEIIGLPIQKNFREGLTITDFIISSYGARKGLVDTAIRTADSGYLTRRLIDIAQDVIIRHIDCRTNFGIIIDRYHKNPKFKITFSERLLGRVLAKSIYDPISNKEILKIGQEIDYDLANKLDSLKFLNKVYVRSPLTCQSNRSICQKCYGWDLAQAKLIKIGEAVGIIAAQSIGEPGTQLTMRTFHTGGIFTYELGQEIKIDFPGQINFSPNLKSHFIRNMKGEYAQVLEKSSFIEIINYKNEKIKINLSKDTILLINNKDFVKKNQIIAQIPLPSKQESEEEIKKEIINKFSGEVYFQVKKEYNFFEYNTLVWVLSGKIYRLPFEAKKNLNLLSKLHEYQSIGKTKLVSKFKNNIQKVKNIYKNKIELLQPFSFFKDIKIVKNINSLTQNIDEIRYLLIDNDYKTVNLNNNLKENITLKESILLGDVLSLNYKTKTGGILHNLNIKLLQNKINSYIEIANGGTLLWIPEESYPLNRDSSIVLVDNGNIVTAGTEIAKNVFCKNNGIIQLKEKTKIIQDICIKIAKIYSFKKKLVNIKNFFNFFDNKFFFPGEVLFENVKIKTVIFTEVFIGNDFVNLIVRPVNLYHISKPKIYKPKIINNKASSQVLLLKYKNFLFTKDGEKMRISSNNSLTLLKSKIFLTLSSTSKEKQINLIFNKSQTSDNFYNLIINNIEKFLIFDQLQNQLKKQEFNTNFLVNKNQILEPYTIFGSFHIIDKKFKKIYEVKSKYSKYQEILIISDQDIRDIFLNEILLKNYLKKINFLFEQDKLSDELKINNSGKILSQKGTLMKIRKAKPYLFSEGAILQKNHKDFIFKDETLGLLIFKILKTEDIVQGLPKIEEILEARIPKQCSKSFENTGLITLSSYNNLNKTLILNLLTLSENCNSQKIIEIPYNFTNIENHNIKNFQQVSLGQSINDGVLNTHEVLLIYFNYYQKRDSLYKATLRSLKKIASLLIDSIQSIYYSQGVRISDKHIEVILRQMMSKVKIEEAGETPFLPGEFLNIKHIKVINEMLYQRNKKLIYYKPIILGLTKASLTTESFISAASFQETTRVLTQAAIEGKIDWLRGLKENVIIGNLIPAGSGFSSTTDLSKRFLLYKINKTTI
jgi:DNA-directed RNA polymerase subunit beta'